MVVRRSGPGKRRTGQGTFQGTAQAFQATLQSEPYLIAAALVVVYLTRHPL
jgi:multidrug efflux pump